MADSYDELLADFRQHLFFLHPPEGSWFVDGDETLHGCQQWKSNWIQKNLKRIAYIIFSTGGVAYGLYFSQLVQSLPPAPWWLYLLRSVGVIVPLPHVIPSAIGMCLEDEPGCGPVKSTVPITFRWCTRGDDNSHLTRASVEMAHKILVEEGTPSSFHVS